jgi:cellulose biosynthesis protein BcsQ
MVTLESLDSLVNQMKAVSEERHQYEIGIQKRDIGRVDPVTKSINKHIEKVRRRKWKKESHSQVLRLCGIG